MKKIFLIAAISLVAKISMAQINTNLSMVPMPPGTLIDWDNKTLAYIVSGGAGLIARVIIKAEIKASDGTVAATTNLTRAKTITAGAANLVLYVGDVMPLDIMIFNGKYKTSLERSGKLPADNYQLCVQLVRPTDFAPQSEVKCRNFNIAAFQLPIPMMPANESILDLEKAQTTITFRWTPVAPRPAGVLTYRVTVFEILEHQTPLQALRSNQPLLAQDIKGTTQFIWQPQLGLSQCCGGADETNNGKVSVKMTNSVGTSPAVSGGRREIKPDSSNIEPDAYAFIWTVQTFDSQGRPFGDGNINGDGISEPNVFFIDRRPPAMRRSGPPSRSINMNGKKN